MDKRHFVLDTQMEPLFSGTPEEVLEWLETNEFAGDAMWVRSGLRKQVIFASEYVAEAKRRQRKRFTEAEIRIMIREELKSLLESMAETAKKADGKETSDAESSALAAIYDVAQTEAEMLPHSWVCQLRTLTWHSRCTCGVPGTMCISCGMFIVKGSRGSLYHQKHCSGENS